MGWYIIVINKYAVFEGRAMRKEYWVFILFHTIILVVLATIDNLIFPPHNFPFILSGLYWLSTIIPSLAVSIRRLHDIGWSGWGLLIGLIPYLGALILIILFLSDSESGDNMYGPNPKDIEQKLCINCRGEVEKNDKFCPACGFNLAGRDQSSKIESKATAEPFPEEERYPLWSEISRDPSKIDPTILEQLQKSMCFMIRDDHRPVAAIIMRAMADQFRISPITKCRASLYIHLKQNPKFNLFGIYPLIWDNEREPIFRETWMTGVGNIIGPPDPLKEGEGVRLELLLAQDYTYFLVIDPSDKLIATWKVLYSSATKKHFKSFLNKAKMNTNTSISNIEYMAALRDYLNTVQMDTVIAAAKKIR